MTQWFYARGGQQNGPVTFEQLVELARNGGLDATRDSVWNESMQGWTPAGQIPGLFGASLESPVPPSGAANPYAAPQSNWNEFVPSMQPALSEIEPGSDVIDPMVCLTRGIEIVKRQFVNILLVGLVYFGCVMGLSIVVNLIDVMSMAMSSGGFQNPGEPSGLRITFQILSQIVMQVLSIFLQLGLVRIGLNLVSGKEVSVGMLFGQGAKLLRAIGASILFGIAVLIGILLLIVPGIYIALRYGHFMTAIVDRDLGIMEAFEYSSSITTNNRMNLFLLALLCIGVTLIGLLLCFVGLIFAAPVVWLTGLVAYRWMQYGRSATLDQPGTQNPMLNAV